MADLFRVLEFILDEDLAAAKREVMSHAATARVMGAQDGHEDTVLQVTLEVNLNAVLRSQASCRIVQQVQQVKGPPDHSATEVRGDTQ